MLFPYFSNLGIYPCTLSAAKRKISPSGVLIIIIIQITVNIMTLKGTIVAVSHPNIIIASWHWNWDFLLALVIHGNKMFKNQLFAPIKLTWYSMKTNSGIMSSNISAWLTLSNSNKLQWFCWFEWKWSQLLMSADMFRMLDNIFWIYPERLYETLVG